MELKASTAARPSPSRRETEKTARNALLVVYSLFCLEVLFAIPLGAVYLVNRSRSHAIAAVILTLAIVAAAWSFRRRLLSAVDRLVARLPLAGKHWLLAWFAIGLLLRLAWMLCFPISPRHDEMEYFQKAMLMAQGLPQTTLFPRTSLFMPPGWPLFLAPFFYVLGARVWVAKLCGLLLFAGAYWTVYRLARVLCGERPARLAVMLLAIWPSYLTYCEVNGKENLLAFLLPAALLAYVSARNAASHQSADSSKNIASFALPLLAGVLLGCATLAQPSFLLFPLVLAGIELLDHSTLRRSVVRVAIVAVGMVLAISPWTARNYFVTGRFVPISTNGGQLFYFQNNPLADFHHSDSGPAPLPSDEILASSVGYRLGAQWVAAYPAAYAALFEERQLYFLSDDTSGLYSTLKFWFDPSGEASPPAYRAAKLAVNACWFAVWVLLLLGGGRFFAGARWPLRFGVLILPFLYQVLMDSAFEAETPHKIPYLALIAIGIGVVATKPHEGSTAQSEQA